MKFCGGRLAPIKIFFPDFSTAFFAKFTAVWFKYSNLSTIFVSSHRLNLAPKVFVKITSAPEFIKSICVSITVW